MYRILILWPLLILCDVYHVSYGALPDSLSLSEFGEIVVQFSEEAGFYPGDNFVSNETSYLHPMPTLIEKGSPGGVYIGVGTEQNFSYIAATRPEIAFILDIRRENLLQHFLYKVVFTLSPDRTTFLSLLFSRHRKTETDISPDRHATISDIMAYIEAATGADSLVFHANWLKIDKEIRRYGMEQAEDLKGILYIYRSFYTHQLAIKYADIKLRNGLAYPTFKDLVMSTAIEGDLASFLGSNEAYQYVKLLHHRHLIIPLVGNFSGDKTFRAIAAYARAHETRVSVLYTSNVEYFLIDDFYHVFEWYVENVNALPIDENSVLIRAYLGMASHPKRVDRHLSTTTVHYIQAFLDGYDRGDYRRSKPIWWRFWPWGQPYWSGGGHSYYHLVILGDLCP